MNDSSFIPLLFPAFYDNPFLVEKDLSRNPFLYPIKPSKI